MSDKPADKEPTFVTLGEVEEALKFKFHTILYGDDNPYVERRTPEQIAREPGFYWVKFDGEWSVDQWTGREWLMVGSEETTSADVGEIGPRVEPPQ
ncbi:hypothetical protein [Caulobacter sp. UC70_42]|uniref:hypothetical protein n=1 Tax=Caulobacter sp. UC70_42 TaxID=3374551 RepID=UPI003757F02A